MQIWWSNHARTIRARPTDQPTNGSCWKKPPKSIKPTNQRFCVLLRPLRDRMDEYSKHVCQYSVPYSWYQTSLLLASLCSSKRTVTLAIQCLYSECVLKFLLEELREQKKVLVELTGWWPNLARGIFTSDPSSNDYEINFEVSCPC